jgi:hypothetical protein
MDTKTLLFLGLGGVLAAVVVYTGINMLATARVDAPDSMYA